MLDCEFTTPLNYTGSPPADGEPFAFSEMSCNSDFFQKYENIENGGLFYTQKTISYGDMLVLTFLILFFCAGVFKILWNFNFKDWNAKI
jgi:hypothetical protein